MTELERYEGLGAHLDQTTDSWVLVLEKVADLANKIARTDFVGDGFRGNVAATAAAILYGREVGFGPMQSLSTLHSIKGRVAMSAEAMRAKALAAGHDIVIAESTTARCTVKGRRRGSDEWTTVTWTIDDARQAKLGGDNWTKYARQMLQARATAELCRLVFADVIHGLAAVEELEQEGGQLLAAVETSRVQRRRPAALPPPPPTPAPQVPSTVDTPPLDDTRTAGPAASTAGPVPTAGVRPPDPAAGADDVPPTSSAPPPDTTPPGHPPIEVTAAITSLTRKLGGSVADLVSPIVGRNIQRSGQLTVVEADLVLGELQAQHDQTRQDDNTTDTQPADDDELPLEDKR